MSPQSPLRRYTLSHNRPTAPSPVWHAAAFRSAGAASVCLSAVATQHIAVYSNGREMILTLNVFALHLDAATSV